MAKYKVQLGSLVTKLMTRTFTVSAQNEAEARLKELQNEKE